MYFGIVTSVQAEYDLVDTYTCLHYFVGCHRHTFKKIFKLY